MVYMLPILDSCLRSPVATALLLFPTKALAQDQLGAISDMTSRVASAGGCSISADCYDG